MKQEYARIVPMTILLALLAACGRESAQQEASESKVAAKEDSKPSDAPADSMQGMSMPKDEAPQPQQHMAMGTITAVDAGAGTVTIAHEAVASAAWPAMTMTFRLADPKQAANLHTNDKVHFTFTLDDKGDATVSTIAPADGGM